MRTWDGWMNQAYSRLSTTHGHITDCMRTWGSILQNGNVRHQMPCLSSAIIIFCIEYNWVNNI